MDQATRSLLVVAGAFIALLAAGSWAFGLFVDGQGNPNRDIAAGSGEPTRVELERNRAGQYLVPGRINGEAVDFLVDTGATHVAVPQTTAERLGLERGQEMRVQTAGGVSRAWDTTIDRIRIGGIERRDIRGSIIPDMSEDYVLLGMTFLREIDFAHRNDRLILEQP